MPWSMPYRDESRELAPPSEMALMWSLLIFASLTAWRLLLVLN
ncbi:MAG TPA: hypothetical protein VLW85_20870 [Myxococcales bacterium]|nr:hypothetical protein [Myxococcales bacterium]